jgi:hypothetical protein
MAGKEDQKCITVSSQGPAHHLNIQLHPLKHGYPICGPPDCSMQPTVTFVSCVYTIKIHHSFRQLGIPLTVILPRVAS